jgi:hypothetical protein
LKWKSKRYLARSLKRPLPLNQAIIIREYGSLLSGEDPSMRMFRNYAAAAIAAFALAACSEPPPKPAMRENLVQRKATVESIDQASRLVTLRGEDGVTTTIQVSDEVSNLPQVKAGDEVIVSYYEALAAEVKKPGAGVQGVESEVAAVRAPAGSMPAASVGVLVRTTVTIQSVDKKLNTVTFTRSDGTWRTVTIESPEGREFTKGLKKGDQVEVAYTEALAIEVKPAG